LGTGLAPAFSISGRGKSPIDERVLNPGPGAYESGNQDKYKARSPSYSISSRTNIPTDQTQKPGPGAHSPEKVRLLVLTHLSQLFYPVNYTTRPPPPFVVAVNTYPSLSVPLRRMSLPNLPRQIPLSEVIQLLLLRPRTHLISAVPCFIFLVFSFLFHRYHQIQIKQESSPAHTFGMKHSPYLGKLKGL
jgi:hypothetical protein